jgi:hypothetical protein
MTLLWIVIHIRVHQLFTGHVYSCGSAYWSRYDLIRYRVRMERAETTVKFHTHRQLKWEKYFFKKRNVYWIIENDD